MDKNIDGPDRSGQGDNFSPATGMPWPPAAWAAGLTLLLLCGPLLPAAKLFPTPASYLPFHTMLEFLVMAVSAMVFALGWNLRHRDENGLPMFLAAACIGYALVDMAHTLSYQGMPDFVTPSGPEKAIYFWLAGRLLMALALLGMAILPARRCPLPLCHLAVVGSVGLAALIWWVGLYHPDILPRTFIPGEGLTPFKIGAEVVEAALFALAAAFLFRRARREGRANLYWLAAGAWTLALAGLFFTLYRDVTDLLNVLGHLYMALAYLMVYRAVFVAGVAAPYEALARQQDLLHSAVDSLRTSEASLQAYRDRLEDLVAARTQELEEARADAERLSRVKGDFLANMSHEIRTPLNGILGLAQIGERQHADPKVRQSFRRILDSGEMLLEIVNDILDFSKIEADKLRLEEGEVDLGNLIDHAVDLLAVRAWSKGLDFRVVEAPDLPAIFRGDALRLSQVLVNLLSNAIKFTEQGRVTLEARREGDTLVLAVSDTGIGMGPGQISRLFAPFEQADGSTTRRFGGTGLGLTICKRLMDLMGGEIRVESEELKGSRFEIRLPLADVTPPAPVPTDLAVLGRFSHFEGRELMGALAARGMKVAEATGDSPLPAQAALVVTPAEALEDDLYRRELELALEAGCRVAVVPAWGQADGGFSLGPGASTLQRPIRPRRVAALLSGPAPVSVPSSPLPRLEGLAILAAEDNPVNRMVLEDILLLEGARLVCLEDGWQALEQLHRDGPEAYDLVITDIQMPGMDGYELARRIRETVPEMPVVGLTAHALAEARTRCLEAGMVEHVAKPIDIERLVAVIRRHSRRPPRDASAPLRSDAAPAESSAPPAGGGAIDWESLEKRYQGRTAFIDKILGITLRHNEEIPAILRAAALAGDLQRLAFLAHGLKSTAGNLAARALQDLAARAEEAARNALPEAAVLAVRLAEGLEEMLAEIAACRPAEIAAG